MPSHASHGKSSILSVLTFISVLILLIASLRCCFKKLYPPIPVEEETISKSTKNKKKRVKLKK